MLDHGVIHSSDFYTYALCPAKYYYDKTNPIVEPEQHYLFGGRQWALAMELFHRYDASVPEIIQALAQNQGPDSGMILQRIYQLLPEYTRWWNQSGFTALYSELDMRVKYLGRTFAGKGDLIAVRDGEVYLIDHKTHGCWGKSPGARPMLPEAVLRMFQLRFYLWMLEQPNVHCSLDDYPRDQVDIPADIEPPKPTKIAVFEAGVLFPYKRGPQAGQWRGDPLTVVDPVRDGYVEERITELLADYTFARRETFARGQSSCDHCRYAQVCWPDQPADGKLPSFLE